jgi:hypothetical protein
LIVQAFAMGRAARVVATIEEIMAVFILRFCCLVSEIVHFGSIGLDVGKAVS